MGVFLETEIAHVMYLFRDRVKGLSKYLFGGGRTEMMEKYIRDCDKNNCDGINAAIDQGLCRLLHSQSPEKGMIKFAERFPELHFDLHDKIFERDIIVELSRHAGEILRIIDENSRGRHSGG